MKDSHSQKALTRLLLVGPSRFPDVSGASLMQATSEDWAGFR